MEGSIYNCWSLQFYVGYRVGGKFVFVSRKFIGVMLSVGACAGSLVASEFGNVRVADSSLSMGSDLHDHLAEEHGLSVEETKDLLAAKKESSGIADELVAQLGDRIVGVVIHETTGELTVYVTDTGAAAIVEEVGAVAVVVNPVEGLDKAVEDASEILDGLDVEGYSIEKTLELDGMIVTVPDTLFVEEHKRAEESLLELDVPVTVQSGPALVETSSLFGGEGISSGISATTHACSAGFNVRQTTGDDAGEEFLITAGHCAQTIGNPWYDVNQGWSEPNYIGETVWTGYDTDLDSSDDGGYELSMIHLPDDGDHNARNEVQWDTDYDISKASESPLGKGGMLIYMTGIVDESNLYIGLDVCKTGASTGTTCGTIDGTNRRTGYGVTAMRTSLEATGGDSGAAVFTVDVDEDGNPTGTGEAVGIFYASFGFFEPLSDLEEATEEEFEVL